MSLVNDWLKFQMAILLYFLLKKCRIAKDSHIFSTKYNSVFAYVVDIYFTTSGLNDDKEVFNNWSLVFKVGFLFRLDQFLNITYFFLCQIIR